MKRLCGVLLILTGMCLFLYPEIRSQILAFRSSAYIKDFDSRFRENAPQFSDYGSGEINTVQKEEDELYQEALAYNSYIYETKQADFKDMYSYVQMPVSLDSLECEAFGYLEIPAMDVTMPLYVGASDENMERGAAILGQTSLPTGGPNTNSVIAGHRGWRGAPYFLDIEKLSAGDEVRVMNPWEKLVYRVESIRIIDPYDTEAVLIQEGRDMVTLITCHPYLSHGKYRYVVYCVRDEDGTDKEADHAGEDAGVTVSDGIVYEPSQGRIRQERILRRAGAFGIMAIAWTSFLYCRKQGKKQKRRKGEPM